MAPSTQFQLTLQHWRSDLAGGFTAAVVARPLALAFGFASGAGALAGLYGAITLALLGSLDTLLTSRWLTVSPARITTPIANRSARASPMRLSCC